MDTNVERIDGNTVELTVTVPASEVDAAIDRAYATVAQKVKLPGFRPGKAPRPVIDSNVGRDYVLGEAQDDLLNATYPSAVAEERLQTIANPEVEELADLVPGEKYTYTAKVQVKPELTLSSIEGLTAEVPSVEVTDREVEAQIEHTRERFASLEPVTDRGVAENDFVLVSFTGTVDGEAYEGNVVDKYLYEMNKGLMPAEFDAGLLGVEAGGATRIEFVVPDTSSNPDFVGKTAAFDVEVHEIKAKVLPELDEEFAENAGGFESMDAMREDIRTKLAEAKASGRERMLERAVRTSLAERLEGEVPESMVATRAESMLREFVGNLESRGMNVEQYAQATGHDPSQILEDVSQRARMMVTEELALEALFRAAGLEVTDEDVDEEFARFAEATETDVAELKERWAGTPASDMLIEGLAHRKAVEWLVDPENVEIIDVDPSTTDADTGETDTTDDAGEGPSADAEASDE